MHSAAGKLPLHGINRQGQNASGIHFDAGAIELEAKRPGLTLEQAREAVFSDRECRLHDAMRHRHAVERVGTTYSTERKAS